MTTEQKKITGAIIKDIIAFDKETGVALLQKHLLALTESDIEVLMPHYAFTCADLTALINNDQYELALHVFKNTLQRTELAPAFKVVPLEKLLAVNLPYADIYTDLIRAHGYDPLVDRPYKLPAVIYKSPNFGSWLRYISAYLNRTRVQEYLATYIHTVLDDGAPTVSSSFECFERCEKIKSDVVIAPYLEGMLRVTVKQKINSRGERCKLIIEWP